MLKCKMCGSEKIQLYNAIIFCCNCYYSLYPDQYINTELKEPTEILYDNIYGKNEFKKIIKKYKEKGMPVRKEFKLSHEYYLDWSDLANIVIGNYDKDQDGNPIKKPRIHCSSLDKAIEHIIKMPSINEVQTENIDKIAKSLKAMEEKFVKMIENFQDGIEEALKNRIDELEDEIIKLKEKKIIKLKRNNAQ